MEGKCAAWLEEGQLEQWLWGVPRLPVGRDTHAPSTPGGGDAADKAREDRMLTPCSHGMRMEMPKPRAGDKSIPPPGSFKLPESNRLDIFVEVVKIQTSALAAWDFPLAALHLLSPFQTPDKPNIILQSRHLARSSGQASQPVAGEINEPVSVADFIKVYEK